MSATNSNKYANITIEPAPGYEATTAPAEHRANVGDIDIEPAAAVVKSAPVKQKTHMKQSTSKIVTNTIIYIILALMVVVWLFPFFGILVESFRETPTSQVGSLFVQYNKSGEAYSWGFGNYIGLFKDSEKSFGRWYLNTLILGVGVSILQTVFVLSMSYVLSRLRFKGRKGLMNFMLVLGMFPGFLTLILLYRLLADMGLTGQNSIWGLLLVYVASSGMGYYVSKGFFDTIPRSLDEAARVDGASRFLVFRKVILPMAKPIVIYTILMGFMAPWGDFMMAMFIAHGTDKGMNVAVGLQSMISGASLADNYTKFCAGGVLVAIPITLLFIFLQKYYVEGVTGGAVKG